MRRGVIIGTVALLLTANSAFAGDTTDRVVDGVLGGLGGALIGGPIGLFAGAAVGATAGPGIAHSWGLDDSRRGQRASGRHASSHKASAASAPRQRSRAQPATQQNI